MSLTASLPKLDAYSHHTFGAPIVWHAPCITYLSRTKRAGPNPATQKEPNMIYILSQYAPLRIAGIQAEIEINCARLLCAELARENLAR